MWWGFCKIVNFCGIKFLLKCVYNRGYVLVLQKPLAVLFLASLTRLGWITLVASMIVAQDCTRPLWPSLVWERQDRASGWWLCVNSTVFLPASTDSSSPGHKSLTFSGGEAGKGPGSETPAPGGPEPCCPELCMKMWEHPHPSFSLSLHSIYHTITYQI